MSCHAMSFHFLQGSTVPTPLSLVKKPQDIIAARALTLVGLYLLFCTGIFFSV